MKGLMITKVQSFFLVISFPNFAACVILSIWISSLPVIIELIVGVASLPMVNAYFPFLNIDMLRPLLFNISPNFCAVFSLSKSL